MCQLVLIIQGLVIGFVDHSGLQFPVLANFTAQWHRWWSGTSILVGGSPKEWWQRNGPFLSNLSVSDTGYNFHKNIISVNLHNKPIRKYYHPILQMIKAECNSFVSQIFIEYVLCSSSWKKMVNEGDVVIVFSEFRIQQGKEKLDKSSYV